MPGVLLLLAAAPLRAQTTASILGTVTDDTSAVVVGAAVRAVNTLTNEVRNTKTDETGYYRFAELGVGLYNVEAEAAGFKTAIRQGIELSLNRNARVDIQLSVGAVTESVSVIADAPLVEATTNEMGVLVSQQRVVELPLNGRNTLGLVGLIPGAQGLQTGNAQGFIENKVSINGAREEDSNWMLDGGDNTSTLRNYGNDVPNPDAVQEFRVVTSNYSAEYGRTVGAVVNVVTKGGTNEYHGSLFHFLRNRSLNARDFFEPDTSPLVQNQFGGSMGGRILRDKTFFFGSFQGFRQRTSDFRNNALVPTQAERSGDFSRTVIGGNPVIVRDPLTSQPFPNNIIPKDRLSPIAQKYLDIAVPLPNDPARGPNALVQRASHPRDNDQFLVKIDHLLSNNHKLSGAYFWSDSVDTDRFLGSTAFAWRDIKSRQHNLNIHEYWTISPTMLNHFRATYTRSAGDRKIMPDNITMLDLGAKWTPPPDGPPMPPDFEVVGWFDNGTANGGPKYANHYTLADTFDWVKGRHELKFGAEGWLQRMTDVSTAPRMGGSFVFDGSVTGNAMTDLLLSQVRTLEVASQTYKSQNSWVLHWFVQDKLRVSRKLILNLGLRHELNTWPVHPLDALIAIVPGRQSTCVPQAPVGAVFPCDDGVPRSGVLGDYNNFAPRVGIAYDLTGDGKTVVRTGYGISYSFNFFNALQEQQVSVPFQYRATIRNTTLEDPYAPIGGSPFPFLFDAAHLTFPASGSYGFQDFNMRTGYVQQYNFSIQRQLGADWSVEAAYVGNVGRKLMGQTDFNAPLRTPDANRNNVDQRRPLYPAFRDMRMTGGFVNSSYNALQTRVERRFSRGLTVLGSYTFGKALDESSWYSSRNEWADTYNRALNKGRGENDRAHLLSLSWVWEIPGFSGSSGLAKALFQGWSANGIATFYSGGPVEIATGKDNDFDGNSSGDRPDVVGAWKLDPNRSRSEVIQAWFNPKAFVENGLGQLGMLGRNVVTGPGMKNVDLGISRSFRVTEASRLQFRAEAFNLFNWVNLESPQGNVSNALFGQITSARDPRIVQFGLKFLF
ncbi:MAG TPA: carboxypeptidase regulatory-like domain-containing protein [Bryobacteraceae bacterium]|nr:carboxypeptidase regulatory-like domain-containing protein [Bryobacteraceae bacterium]